jgi:hypothetical protein
MYKGSQMKVIDTKTDKELIQSLLAEIAKSRNELKCARADIDKATSRVMFCIAVLNEMIDRQEI